ncbi:extracellular solute-binding protein [Paenibacillus ginsengarvi]|uniref:extracellular solute-binding protein n=1 Tax=Paenibacillus ginsengarvi TaxID=400777 RepID=UPI001960DBFB|nr:extracellular solute-binding protein [Paenibacillus ginsengarvi]
MWPIHKNRPSKQQHQEQLNVLVTTLRQEITEGVYPPESYLPSEIELSKRFSLSNKSLRKGLEVLEKEGYIRKIPRVGNQIVPPRPRVVIRFGCSQTIMRDLRMRDLIDAFHLLHPHIHVEVVPYTSVIPELIGDGEPLDLLSANVYQFLEIVRQGLAVQLEELPEPEGTHPFLLEPFRQEGKLLVQPLGAAPIVLCYNKAHFAESGVPEPDGSWSWDELAIHATALSDRGGRYGFGFHAISENRWPIFMLQSGRRDEWEAPWENESLRRKLKQNMQICKDILHNRAMSPLFLSENDREITKLFLDGKLSIILTNYAHMNDFINADLDYDISPVPTQHDPATLLVSIGACISKRSLHKEEAHLFLRYLASRHAQELIQVSTFTIPSYRPLWENPVASTVKKPGRYGLFREILFTFRTHKDLQFSDALRLKLVYLLKEYWANLIGEDVLCDRMFQHIREDRFPQQGPD